MGYIWNDYLQQYEAGAGAIRHLNEKITEAKDAGASEHTINELQTQLYNLEAELTKNDPRDALINLLTNYTDVSDDTLSAFKA